MAPVYSFFRLNISGVVDTQERLSLKNDGSAMSYAEEMRHPSAVDIWDGRRKVGVVPPHRAEPIDRRSLEGRVRC